MNSGVFSKPDKAHPPSIISVVYLKQCLNKYMYLCSHIDADSVYTSSIAVNNSIVHNVYVHVRVYQTHVHVH